MAIVTLPPLPVALSSLISVPDKVGPLQETKVQARSLGSLSPPACLPSLMTPVKVPLVLWSKTKIPPALLIAALAGRFAVVTSSVVPDLEHGAAGIGVGAGELNGAGDQVEDAGALDRIVECRTAIAGILQLGAGGDNGSRSWPWWKRLRCRCAKRRR